MCERERERERNIERDRERDRERERERNMVPELSKYGGTTNYKHI